MRSFFLSFLILSFLLSCSDKNKLPEGVLPKQKMQEVLWDMIRAGEFLNGFVFYKDTAVDKVAESQKWYNKIYQLHKITKSGFDKSYTYYQAHPVLMKELLDSLSKKQVPVKPATQDSAAIKDSIIKRIPPPLIDRRLKIIDTLKKRKIIKKKKNYKAV